MVELVKYRVTTPNMMWSSKQPVSPEVCRKYAIAEKVNQNVTKYEFVGTEEELEPIVQKLQDTGFILRKMSVNQQDIQFYNSRSK